MPLRWLSARRQHGQSEVQRLAGVLELGAELASAIELDRAQRIRQSSRTALRKRPALFAVVLEKTRPASCLLKGQTALNALRVSQSRETLMWSVWIHFSGRAAFMSMRRKMEFARPGGSLTRRIGSRAYAIWSSIQESIIPYLALKWKFLIDFSGCLPEAAFCLAHAERASPPGCVTSCPLTSSCDACAPAYPVSRSVKRRLAGFLRRFPPWPDHMPKTAQMAELAMRRQSGCGQREVANAGSSEADANAADADVPAGTPAQIPKTHPPSTAPSGWRR